MPQDETDISSNGAEAIADITDQTLAEEAPGDIPSLDDVETGEEEESDDPTALRARLDEANQRADAEHESYLRARADLQNYRRRTEEEKQKLRGVVSEDLLKRLLPIVDNFERALQSANATQDYDKLVGGVNAILRQMQEFLAKEGVTAIEAVGQPFDPNQHEAVASEETTEYPENTVTEELQKGYALGERVLRPSMVKVAIGAE